MADDADRAARVVRVLPRYEAGARGRARTECAERSLPVGRELGNTVVPPEPGPVCELAVGAACTGGAQLGEKVVLRVVVAAGRAPVERQRAPPFWSSAQTRHRAVYLLGAYGDIAPARSLGDGRLTGGAAGGGTTVRRRAAWFVMMPLCTTAKRLVRSEPCGWLLRAEGAPCVAQRVCAM